MTLLAIILQIALEVFSKDPGLSAGSLCGYHPQDTLTTPAPKGYKPIYISHIARHGSRYISNGSSDRSSTRGSSLRSESIMPPLPKTASWDDVMGNDIPISVRS